eukprot:scaffold264494_cov27-Tisochrysis_lutea.AAC.10
MERAPLPSSPAPDPAETDDLFMDIIIILSVPLLSLALRLAPTRRSHGAHDHTKFQIPRHKQN